MDRSGSRRPSPTLLWYVGAAIGWALLAWVALFVFLMVFSAIVGRFDRSGLMVESLAVISVIALAAAFTRLARRTGAPARIWIAVAAGSTYFAIIAAASAYALVAPVTPGLDASIVDATRGANVTGLMTGVATAIGAPIAAFFARGRVAPADGIEQANRADGAR